MLLVSTALVLLSSAVIAFYKTRDILHPLLFLAPLFLYSCVLEPWLVRSELDRFFANPDDLNLVLVLNLMSVSALMLGGLHRLTTRMPARLRANGQRSLNDGERATLRHIAAALALVGLLAYSVGIVNAGGFVSAFSQVKGGGYSSSGYIGESMNLGLVAAAMIALSQLHRRWTATSLAVLVLGLLPNLVQGTFGGRRGPLFLVLAAAMFSWVISRRRTPRLATVGTALAVILMAVVFVGSQRQRLHLGSDDLEIRWDDFATALTLGDIDQSNNFVYGAGLVIATQKSSHYTWGRELAVNLLVRPIPKQVWPDKYADVGATWVTSDHPGLGALTPNEWLFGVGWVPFQGSSAMCIFNLFADFSWGAVVVMYLIGRAFAELRYRRLAQQGVWDLLYLEALMLTIYLATQSFSAFYHRYLILAVPTLLMWELFVKRHPSSSKLSLNARYQRARAPRRFDRPDGLHTFV
jgi:hypothetical protein